MTKKLKDLSRRDFIGKTALTAAAFTIVPRHVLGGPGYKAPSDTLNIACVGIDGKGESDIEAVSIENIVALCDVDDSRGIETRKKHPKANQYRDFRIMLEREKNIDAVTVSTPDHTHAAIAIAAMVASDINQGKVNILKYDREQLCYYPVKIDMYNKGTEKENGKNCDRN